LLAVGSALFVVALGIVIEGLRAFVRNERHETEAVVFAAP